MSFPYGKVSRHGLTSAPRLFPAVVAQDIKKIYLALSAIVPLTAFCGMQRTLGGCSEELRSDSL